MTNSPSLGPEWGPYGASYHQAAQQRAAQFAYQVQTAQATRAKLLKMAQEGAGALGGRLPRVNPSRYKELKGYLTSQVVQPPGQLLDLLSTSGYVLRFSVIGDGQVHQGHMLTTAGEVVRMEKWGAVSAVICLPIDLGRGYHFDAHQQQFTFFEPAQEWYRQEASRDEELIQAMVRLLGEEGLLP